MKYTDTVGNICKQIKTSLPDKTNNKTPVVAMRAECRMPEHNLKTQCFTNQITAHNFNQTHAFTSSTNHISYVS